LIAAKNAATKAHDTARRGGVATAVAQDVRGLLDSLNSNFARAERDNDLIYHQDVPSLSTIDPIAPVSMVKSTLPPGLSNPQVVLEKAEEGVIFGELMAWGAKEAISKTNYTF
jgi:programmed cell death 6-interacting protein